VIERLKEKVLTDQNLVELVDMVNEERAVSAGRNK